MPPPRRRRTCRNFPDEVEAEAIDSRADGDSSAELRVQPATFEWIRWGSPWRTSTPSAVVADDEPRRAGGCASATFPDGTPIDGVRGLRLHPEPPRQLCRNVHAKRLTYALGRLVDYRDKPAILKITAASTMTAGRLSSRVSSGHAVPVRKRVGAAARHQRRRADRTVEIISERASPGGPCSEAWAPASPCRSWMRWCRR